MGSIHTETENLHFLAPQANITFLSTENKQYDRFRNFSILREAKSNLKHNVVVPEVNS